MHDTLRPPPPTQTPDTVTLIRSSRAHLDRALTYAGIPHDAREAIAQASLNLLRAEHLTAIQSPIPPDANVSDRIEYVHELVPEVDVLTDQYCEYVNRGGRADFSTWRAHYYPEVK